MLWAAAGGVAALALAGPAEASDHPPDPDPTVHAAPAAGAAAEREALQAEKQAARERRLAEQKAAREQRLAELRESHDRRLAEQRALHQQWQDELERRWQEYVEKVRCACQLTPPSDAQPGTQPGPQPDQPADTTPVGQPTPVEQEQPTPVVPGDPSGSQPGTPKPDKPEPAPVDDIGWRDWDEWAADVDQRWQQRGEATRAMWEAVPESDTPVLAAVGATVATVVQYPVVAIVDTVTDLTRPVVQGLDAGLSPVTGGLRPVLQGLRCATAWLTVPLEPLLADTVRVVEGTELLPDTLPPVLGVVVDPRPAGGGQPASPTPDTPDTPTTPAAPSAPVGDGGGQPAPHKPAPDSGDDNTPQGVYTPAGGGVSLDADRGSADRDNQPGPGQPSTPANSGGNSGSGGGTAGLDGVTGGLADLTLPQWGRIHPADTVAASHTCPPPTRPA